MIHYDCGIIYSPIHLHIVLKEDQDWWEKSLTRLDTSNEAKNISIYKYPEMMSRQTNFLLRLSFRIIVYGLGFKIA